MESPALIFAAGYHALFYDKNKRPTPKLGVSVRPVLVEFESGSFSKENKRRKL
ncbi:hypothetical protein [uncultured Fibrobacter sp.]|uniref:hypothetical protein n=1 Tax=uncultured Fibrobacter sp. TaxID=261512 RepID=UPI0025F01B13|nr:hypothetical protein [uncultured Fibrobacter sp.]